MSAVNISAQEGKATMVLCFLRLFGHILTSFFCFGGQLYNQNDCTVMG
jgi:hypothetical protein